MGDEEKNVWKDQVKPEMEVWKAKMVEYKKTDEYREFQEKKKAKKSKKKKAKPPKDPNAPKKPTTAFFLFGKEMRSSIRAENPEAGVAQIGKILGQKWGELSTEEKEAYKKRCNEEKEAFKEIWAKYQESPEYEAHQETLAKWRVKQE